MFRRSHGTGDFRKSEFRKCGTGVVIEPGVLVFHPENIILGDDVYIGHQTILKGYHEGLMRIGKGTWIGQQCFLHGAGGISIGQNVGIGPAVRVLTSEHREEGRRVPILHSALDFAPVHIEDDADIGAGTTILKGVRVERGARVGAGSVLTKPVPAFAVAAGIPARVLRMRTE